MSCDGNVHVDLHPPMKLDSFILNHLGKSSAHGTAYIPKHNHGNFYELTIVTGGSGLSYTRDKPTKVSKGDIYVSYPFENHQIDSSPTDLMSYSFICFDVLNPKYAGRLKRLWFDHIPPENRIIHCPVMATLTDCVISEITEGKNKYSDSIISSILEQITIYLLRALSDRKPDVLSENPTDTELCKHMSHYIDTHLFTMKNLSECARALSYNYCYLSTVYKKNTGITLSEYYRGKKLEMAKMLITDSEYTLSELAEMLGYSGLSQFSKAFKARFGISPRAYLKNVIPLNTFNIRRLT